MSTSGGNGPSTDTPKQTESSSDPSKEDNKRRHITYLQRALEDLVSVNSLFTFAMFVGISFGSDLGLQKECQASVQTKMTLVFDEVVSFVCFLLSSLVATALKMHLSTYLVGEEKNGNALLKDGLRSFMITVSTASSILGCVYLTLSMFNVVRVLLGNITCGPRDVVETAGTLIAINVLALLIYAPSMGNAIYRSHSVLASQK